MAFFNRVGSLLKQNVGNSVRSELSAPSPSLFQAIRCMSTKLFIGGLSYTTDEMSLREAFSQHGEVVEARVIVDRETGRSRGFGFVTFTSTEEASSAIQAFDGQDLHGRRIKVNHATERARTGGFGGGFGAGGGGGGYNYGGQGGGYGRGGYQYDYGGSGGGNYPSGNYGGGGGYGGNNQYPSGGGGGGYGGARNYPSGGGGGYEGGDSVQGGDYGGSAPNHFATGESGFGTQESFGGDQAGIDAQNGGFGQDAVDGNDKDYVNTKA